MLFLRTLSSLLEPCIASYKDDQLRRLENAKKAMTGNVDGKMRYDLKIQGQTYEGKQACTGSPVYGCIKFMRDEGEIRLLEQDVLEQVFEDNYARQEKTFLSLIDAYAGKRNDHGVRENEEE